LEVALGHFVSRVDPQDLAIFGNRFIRPALSLQRYS